MGKGTYLDIPPHLHAAMRVLTLRFFEAPLTLLKPFDHLALESVLYQIFLTSTVLWSDQAPLTDFDLQFWLRAEALLEQNVMFPGKPNSVNSPVLGVPVALFRLAIQAQQVCRRPDLYNSLELERLRRETDTWEGLVLINRTIASSTCGGSTSRHETYYEGASYLYVLIISLLLEQISKNSRCDTGPESQLKPHPEAVPRHTWQVQKAIHIIRDFQSDDDWYSCYIGSWPVYTLGFFLSDAEDIDLIRNEMSRRWTTTGFMQIPRFHDDLETIWSARSHISPCR